MSVDWYDREGKPLTDMAKINSMLCDWDYKVVAQTEVGLYWVSTVWLGLDHNFFGGPPLIFETMVFANDDGVKALDHEFDMRRYATEAEAREGHEATVLLVMATTGADVPAQKEEEA